MTIPHHHVYLYPYIQSYQQQQFDDELQSSSTILSNSQQFYFNIETSYLNPSTYDNVHVNNIHDVQTQTFGNPTTNPHYSSDLNPTQNLNYYKSYGKLGENFGTYGGETSTNIDQKYSYDHCNVPYHNSNSNSILKPFDDEQGRNSGVFGDYFCPPTIVACQISNSNFDKYDELGKIFGSSSRGCSGNTTLLSSSTIIEQQQNGASFLRGDNNMNSSELKTLVDGTQYGTTLTYKQNSGLLEEIIKPTGALEAFVVDGAMVQNSHDVDNEGTQCVLSQGDNNGDDNNVSYDWLWNEMEDGTKSSASSPGPTTGGEAATTVTRKGVRQWNKDEHRMFLLGVKIHGKGSWKNISKFVGTRSPSQVASHAQKHYQRRALKTTTRRRIRDSIHDITEVDDDAINDLRRKGLLPASYPLILHGVNNVPKYVEQQGHDRAGF